MEDLDTRLAGEVTALSTRLVTEVAKSSHLEESLVQLRRESAQMKTRLSVLETADARSQDLARQLAEMTAKCKEMATQKAAAEAKNKQLEGEVEDLTASLFDEANKMVSDASREAYNFKLKNRKLIEELAEKDSIIENLQAQLRDLKQLFVKMEDQSRESRTNTPRVEASGFEFEPSRHGSIEDPSSESANFTVLHQILYGVRGRAVRFDLPAYQLEFKGFVYQLIKDGFSFDLVSLKTLKYFKKLWTEELEPCVPVIPALTGNNFMSRWSKGKSFWGLIVEGKAIIEPVAGVNETFKLTYKGVKTGNEVPVALKDACAFCGESKDDLLEHARLYNLKLYGPATETGVSAPSGTTTEIGGELHAVVGTYPLCNFCLVKLRAICTFFAKLRLVHANIYKLPQNRSYDETAYVNSFQFKRSSENLGVPSSDPAYEPVFVKLYLMMLSLRAQIFWSRVGFWDTHEDVEFLNLDETPIETFSALVHENVAFRAEQDKEVSVSSDSVDTTEIPVHVFETRKSPVGRKKPEGLDTPDVIASSLDPGSSPASGAKQTSEVGKSVTESQKIVENVASETPAESSSVKAESAKTEPSSESFAEASASSLAEKDATVTATDGPKDGPNDGPKDGPTDGPTGKGTKKKGAKAKSANNAEFTNGEAAKVPETSDVAKKETKEKAATKETTEAAIADADGDDDGDFQDSSDTFDSAGPLQRRKSKSKAFKKKMNQELDNTLAALQESLE